eukprot:s466_g7.t1
MHLEPLSEHQLAFAQDSAKKRKARSEHHLTIGVFNACVAIDLQQGTWSELVTKAATDKVGLNMMGLADSMIRVLLAFAEDGEAERHKVKGPAGAGEFQNARDSKARWDSLEHFSLYALYMEPEKFDKQKVQSSRDTCQGCHSGHDGEADCPRKKTDWKARSGEEEKEEKEKEKAEACLSRAVGFNGADFGHIGAREWAMEQLASQGKRRSQAGEGIKPEPMEDQK